MALNMYDTLSPAFSLFKQNLNKNGKQLKLKHDFNMQLYIYIYSYNKLIIITIIIYQDKEFRHSEEFSNRRWG